MFEGRKCDRAHDGFGEHARELRLSGSVILVRILGLGDCLQLLRNRPIIGREDTHRAALGDCLVDGDHRVHFRAHRPPLVTRGNLPV